MPTALTPGSPAEDHRLGGRTLRRAAQPGAHHPGLTEVLHKIASTVLWLNGTYNTDISCYRIAPYQLGDEILLDLQQIIPLAEARDSRSSNGRRPPSAQRSTRYRTLAITPVTT